MSPLAASCDLLIQFAGTLFPVRRHGTAVQQQCLNPWNGAQGIPEFFPGRPDLFAGEGVGEDGQIHQPVKHIPLQPVLRLLQGLHRRRALRQHCLRCRFLGILALQQHHGPHPRGAFFKEDRTNDLPVGEQRSAAPGQQADQEKAQTDEDLFANNHCTPPISRTRPAKSHAARLRSANSRFRSMPRQSIHKNAMPRR